MFRQELFFQDPRRDPISPFIEKISSAINSPRLAAFDAAVAYVSLKGCEELDRQLGEIKKWKTCTKRWLVSIDFGRTEPAGIEFLAKLPNSQVRIHHGNQVVERARFSPLITFHPKIYLGHDASGVSRFFGCVSGSGNLTRSGLSRGAECGTLFRWDQPISAKENDHLVGVRLALEWFDALWSTSDESAEVLPRYKAKWKPQKFPTDEDASEASRSTLQHQAAALENAHYQAAKAMWTSPHRLTRNRGDLPGNQVFFSRGAQVFFGFPAANVPKDTEFGKVAIELDGLPPTTRTVSLSNNHMVKVTLPIPEDGGLATYDDRYLLFRRKGNHKGRRLFHLSALSKAKFDAAAAQFQSHIARKMQGSPRKIGVLF
jgi:hypothetical protein